MDPLIGNMLGDGHLRFTHKDKEGKVRGNSHYAMTSKSYEYIMHLWSNIYYSICTTTLPNPWPNPKTGLIPTQYTFHTKSLIQLTILHKLWYKWSDDLNKFIKIVPLNILDLLTPIGLAH